jgi:hypothetical protein
VKALLKRTLPVCVSRRLRRLGRLRWVTKYRLLRGYGCDPRAEPLVAARFVLADPEVESHSFELANEAELCAFLSRFLGADPARVAAAVAEAKADPVLARDRGFMLSLKRRPPLGRRLSWFVVARLTRPRLVVETGIHDGLGSEALLRALQLNALDGHPGRLVSFDVFADTGWAVAGELRPGWDRVIGSTYDVLEPTLAGRRVDLFVRDTPPAPEHVRFELAAAARHAGRRLVLIDSAGGGAMPVMAGLCRGAGVEGTAEVFVERPLNHVLRENHQAYAVLCSGHDGPAGTPDQEPTADD